jgi:hypothetical protein
MKKQPASPVLHNVSAHSESLLDWFTHLHPGVQITFMLCSTAILILLVFNPVAGGVIASFLLALLGRGNPSQANH